MTPKIKTRQTSKQPISTKQIVALFVHTNQQYIEFSETTKWRDWIWIKTPRVTRSVPGQSWLQSPFSRSCVLFRQDHPRFQPPKTIPPNPLLRAAPKRIPLLNKKKLPPFSLKLQYVLKVFFKKSLFLLSSFFFSQNQSPMRALLQKESPLLNKKKKAPFSPYPFFKSSNSKVIFPISNSSPKPSKESPTFLKLQW